MENVFRKSFSIMLMIPEARLFVKLLSKHILKISRVFSPVFLSKRVDKKARSAHNMSEV